MKLVNRAWTWLLALCLLVSASGATCARRQTISEFTPPPVWTTTPELPQIMEVVNRTNAIQQLQSNSVKIQIDDPSVPAITGTLSLERPRRFRLQAAFSRFTGTELDLGSNETVFWLKTARPTPSMFYAEHDLFDQQTNRKILPVSPLWVTEALGLVTLDPQHQHDPPITRADGNIEIRSLIPSPTGSNRRIVILDPKLGLIRELYFYDTQGNLVAAASQSAHQFYPAVKTSLPHQVKLRLLSPGEQELSFTLDVGFYIVNELMGNDPTRWQMPEFTGLQVVNLVQLNEGAQVAPIPPGYQLEQPIHTSMQYRGFERR